MDKFDVLIVGYGPVGKSLALMLAKKGYTISMVERWAEAYPYPRAVCMDHEIRRVMNGLGLREQLDLVSAPSPRYQWFNGKGQMLLDIDWTLESVSGGPEAYFFHQPSLERMLDAELRKNPNVEINLGWEMATFEDSEDGVDMEIRRDRDGSPDSRVISGQYLVGADGANSMVRAQAGIDWLDLGFHADWLVVDVEPNEGVVLDIPEAGQHCNPTRPTTFVPGGIENGRCQRRWEFMRLPGEDAEELNRPEKVWELLSPWVTKHQARLVRHALYTFRSRVAADWRHGRILLAGDAAHVMPPFMGQGMCSGIRDAFSLAWRLDFILSGKAPDSLLDTYSPERRPHVTQVIDISVHLGRIICVADPNEANARDTGFLERTVPPPPPFPHLTDGLLQRSTDGAPTHLAGTLGIHGIVKSGGVTGELDHIVGKGITLLGWQVDPKSVLDDRLRHDLDALGAVCRRVVPGDAGEEAQQGDIIDIRGKYEAYFRNNGVVAVLVRPDHYVFGAATKEDDVLWLVEDFISALAGNGSTEAVHADKRDRSKRSESRLAG